MNLFSKLQHPDKNHLPKDGIVNYYGQILDKAKADFFLEEFLQHISWKNDRAIIFGKEITTKRSVAWYGDKEFEYTYSKVNRYALPWTKTLLKFKRITEEKTGETYNSCLMNLYHNGNEGVGWHSDGEPDLQPNGAIASWSLGAERRFVFKHKYTKQKVEFRLEHGSLLVMKGATQKFWLHTLPKMKKINAPRVNLTFRTIIGNL